MKRLVNNITSTYIDAANKLRPNRQRRRIVAYVESFDDIAFWRHILAAYENDERYFEIQLPSHSTLEMGKKAALKNLARPDRLGQSLIVCVDADYDWLLQGQTATSRTLCQSPYVIHTYAYAIENYQCYAPSLHQCVCTATLNDRPTFDFVALLTTYSTIVWPLFVWNIWCYRHDEYKTFGINEFGHFAALTKVNAYHPEQALEALRRRVNQKVAWLQRTYPEARKDYATLRSTLQDMGVGPEVCYLFVQGHMLMDDVVLPLLEPLCTMLRKERERDICHLACHHRQQQNELSSYQHSQTPIAEVLRRNTNYDDATPMQWVKQKIEALLS